MPQQRSFGGTVRVGQIQRLRNYTVGKANYRMSGYVTKHRQPNNVLSVAYTPEVLVFTLAARQQLLCYLVS
jgi:hypothetical protein